MRKCRDIYPLTIVKDRYGGVYSGGKWLAYNKQPFEIEESDEYLDDVSCMMFWDEPRMIGVGNTIDEAIEDLDKKLNEQYKKRVTR